MYEERHLIVAGFNSKEAQILLQKLVELSILIPKKGSLSGYLIHQKLLHLLSEADVMG